MNSARGKIATSIISIFLFFLSTVYGQYACDAPLRPDYDIVNLRPSGFSSKTTDIAWLTGGRLLAMDWGGVKSKIAQRQFTGTLYVISGVVTAKKPEDLIGKISVYADKLENPVGLAVVNDTVYTVGGQTIWEFFDADKDGKAEHKRKVFDFAYKEHCRHEFFHGLVLQGDYLYATASTCKASDLIQLHKGRGAAYKIHRITGKAELFAGGLREPYGLAKGPNGDIFSSDNQGRWLPASKLIHIQKDRWYGYRQSNFTPVEAFGSIYKGVKESPPVVYFPHRVIGLSPSHPLLIKEGPYQGQLLVGDVTFGGIQRVFLEKIKGEYQGAVMRYTGGLEAGIGGLTWGEGGVLYAGGIGDEKSWAWCDAKSGLQKLIPNGKKVFEIAAVRARIGGLEIEFSQAVGAAATNASMYTVQQWWYYPTSKYGGPDIHPSEFSKNDGAGKLTGLKTGKKTIPVNTAEADKDKKRIYLSMPNLVEGMVTRILIKDGATGVKSSAGTPLLFNEAFYTLTKFSDSINAHNSNKP